MQSRPNLLFVFGDQWRAQAFGYAGDPNVRTPNVDAFAGQSVNFTNAVSGCPVCSPYRASLLTGQRPLTHGVFVNDRPMEPKGQTLGEAFKAGGYQTAWIGKWHVDGRGRSAFIPPERRRDFEYWRVMECTHDYLNSHYYGDGPEMLTWNGYDAEAQTTEAQNFLRGRDTARPFAMFLSWGPPHDPFHAIPARYKDLYEPANFVLRGNIAPPLHPAARDALHGYYAHCSALDECFGRLLATLHELHLEQDTIVVFTSDHGEMAYSQSSFAHKQQPWQESIRVPLLIRVPGIGAGRRLDLIDAPDLMPTLLSLCGLPTPPSAEGIDLSQSVTAGDQHPGRAVVLSNYFCFHEWVPMRGAREFRGIYTGQYTYVRDRSGPWLLFDNVADPYQLRELSRASKWRDLRDSLDARLDCELAAIGDEFLPGEELLRRWGYDLDPTTGDLAIKF